MEPLGRIELLTLHQTFGFRNPLRRRMSGTRGVTVTLETVVGLFYQKYS